jgi:uncharacterized membrane protein
VRSTDHLASRYAISPIPPKLYYYTVIIYYILRGEEKPTRFHWMVYCTFNTLNILRTLLCPSSGARDYMCVIAAYGVLCLGCWLLKVRCRSSGYAFGMRDVARFEQHPSSRTHSRLPCTWPPNNQQPRHSTPLAVITHIVSSSWWWHRSARNMLSVLWV